MDTNELPFIIQNVSAAGKSAEILIYDSIPALDEDWRMKNTATEFVKQFKKLDETCDTIHIRINSPGGSIYHGFPIFNAIRNAKAKTITYNDGLAASMAGLILLAGKERKSAKNAVLMIHNAISSAYGNSKFMKKHSEFLDTYDGIISQLLSDHSSMSIEEVKEKFMNYEDHFLDANTAKSFNFIDEIEDYESQNPPPKNIAAFGHNQILALYNQAKPHTQTNKNPMNFDELINSLATSLTPENSSKLIAMVNTTLGEKILSTQEEVQAAVNLAIQPINESVVLKDQEITNLTTAKGDLTKKLENAQAEILTLKEDLTKLPTNVGGDDDTPKDFEFLSETDMLLRAKSTNNP